MKRLLIIFIIFFLNIVLAQCSNEQIDLNSASAEELDKITYIGPATASKIISARPFNSVEDLINVSGIGETKLKAIKDQNLVCVKGSEEEIEEIKDEEIQEDLAIDIPIINNIEEESVLEKNNLYLENTLEEVQIIRLNAKDIKEDNSILESKEEISKEKYATFGLVAIFIFLMILISIRRRRNGLE
jgi:competence ComEA-like helix-hairpin-helix protein